ncbi:MAG: L-histidine N(alpha)-methyltransferase [Acidobacteriota bacterium]
MKSSAATEIDQFALDVLAGFSATPKTLSSKYFYDDEGSRLFQQIMRLPEYYLTECEFEIFSSRTPEILEAFAPDGDPFDIVELGAGDGAKTAVLIDFFLKRNADIRYSPIDISPQAIDSLSEKFTRQFPDLRLEAQKGDYFRILESLKNGGGRRKILLFLGSNIGNFSRANSVAFFRELRSVMNDDDRLFIGFDLQKDPHVIVRAYDDSNGVTARFNLNLLLRINRELGADFDLEQFTHYAIYRPVECAARSFLISRRPQTVSIKALDRKFEFDAWEAIFVEISQKYSLSMISELAEESGFKVLENFFDSRRYYVDSLWQPAT